MTATPALVVHHDYATGSAADRSGHGNDGALVGGRFGAGGVDLDGRGDRVVVRPGPGLRDLASLRVDVTVLAHRLDGRQDLVEGYLSFAVSLMADGSVHGAVYDRSGWLSIGTAPGTVAAGRWAHVTYVSDRALGSRLYVDEALAAHDARTAAGLGDVSWPFGLNVGGWPDADLHMLEGSVASVLVWTDHGRHG